MSAFSAVTNMIASVIGVNDGYIEWYPDDIPPTGIRAARGGVRVGQE